MLLKSIQVVLIASLAQSVFAESNTSTERELSPSLPELPKAITSFGAVQTEGAIYVYGGHSGKAHAYSTETTLNTFHRLSGESPAAWDSLESGKRIQGTSLIAFEGFVYRMGGLTVLNESTAVIEDGQSPDATNLQLKSVDDFARFHPVIGKWEPLSPLPRPRSSHDAAVIGQHLYVVGGWRLDGHTDHAEWLDDMWVMDLAHPDRSWKCIPQPFKRRAIAVGILDQKLYVIGGMDSEGNTSREVDIYDPEDGSWRKGPQLPSGPMNGFGAAACSTRSHLFVSPYSGTLLRMNNKRDTWLETGELEPRRFFHRIVALDANHLVVIGGANRQEGHLASLQSLKLELPSL